MKKIFTAAVMCATALSPIVNATAYAAVTGIGTPMADVADSMTVAAMESQCDAAAALADFDGVGVGDRYTGEVVLGAITLLSGPTEAGTEADRAIDLSTRVGAGTFTPGSRQIVGDPYRNGGSVNMFGVQQSTGGRFSASMYDFTAEFISTYSHAFSCNIFSENFVPAQTIFHPAIGIYVVAGDFGESEAAVRGNCAAFSAMQPSDPYIPPLMPSWWGEEFHGGNPNNPHCRFEGTPGSIENIPEGFEDPVLVTNVAGTAVNQTQTDTLMAHEDFGAGFSISETVILGQVVVCISPSKTVKGGTPGAWANHNGYTGNLCTTTWFNGGAMNGVDNLNLQGTFISVPLA